MRKSSKVIILCIFGLLLICETKETEINVLYFAGLPMGQMIKEMIPEFTEKTDITVSFNELPYDAVRAKEITSITQKMGAYDVIYVDDIWMYEYSERGFILPLTEYVKRDSGDVDFFDFIEKVRIAESMLNSTIWLIPQRADAQCLFYRSDLFNDEAYKEEFKNQYGYELKPPDTWNQFRDIAAFFTRDTNGDGKVDLYGTTMTMKRPHFAFEFYAMRYWSFSNSSFFDEDGKPIFNNDAAIQALEFMRELKQYAPPGVSNWQHDEAITAFASGLTAMAPQWFAFYPVFNDTNTSKIVGKLGVTLVPGYEHNGKLVRAQSIGGGSLGIPVDARNKEEAWEFIKFMTSKKFMKRAALRGAIVTRNSSYEDPDVMKNYPDYAIHRKSLDISWFRPRHVKYAEIQEIIGLAVSRVFVGEMASAEALKLAEEEVHKVDLD